MISRKNQTGMASQLWTRNQTLERDFLDISKPGLIASERGRRKFRIHLNKTDEMGKTCRCKWKKLLLIDTWQPPPDLNRAQHKRLPLLRNLQPLLQIGIDLLITEGQ
jgi:hypothetical protein